jgi:hypothetical protein
MKLRPLSAIIRAHKKEYLSKHEGLKKTKSKTEIDKFVASLLKDNALELHISDRHRNWLYIRGLIHGAIFIAVFVPVLIAIIRHFTN